MINWLVTLSSLDNQELNLKKLILITSLCLLFVSSVYSASLVISGSGGAGGSGCTGEPSGTYTLAWNGDADSDLEVCVSGTDSITATNPGSATIGSSYGDTGDGVNITAETHSIKIAATWNNVGTIWFKIDPQYCGSADGNHVPLSFGSGVDNYDAVYLRHRANGNLQVYYRWDTNGIGGQVSYQPGAWTCSSGTYEYLAFTWDNTQAAGSDKLNIWYDGAWATGEEATTLGTAFNNTIDEIEFYGEEINEVTWSDDAIYMDNVAYIAGTYEAANPW